MSRTTRTADRQWRQIAQRVYDEEELCWLCGGWVDQRLPTRHPMSRSADHLVQLKHGGNEHDRQQVRLAHYGCNSSRSSRLQNLPRSECACTWGRPCGRIEQPRAPRGLIQLDPTTV